jgi:hypothetical protein
MILRNLIFDPEIVEERLRAGVMSHHEQQASEGGNEQQPHVQLAKRRGILPLESPDGRRVYFNDLGRLWQVTTDSTVEQEVEGLPLMLR